MGATNFSCIARGNTADEAFDNAKRDAEYEHGHGGYTGTIADKTCFVVVTPPQGMSLPDYAEFLIEEDEEISDKYGPAGCFALSGGRFYFFGIAPE